LDNSPELTVQQNEPPNNPTMEFNAEGVRIIQAWRTGELSFADGLAKMNALIDSAVEAGQRPNEAYGRSLLGVMYHYHGDFEQSIQHYETARQIFAELGNRRHVAGCNLNMGEVYRYLGNYARALQMYRSAVEAAEALNDPVMRAIALTNQGQVLLTLEQYDTALSTLQKALDLTLQLPETEMTATNRASILGELYQSLARLHLLKNQPLESWHEARQALKIATESGEAMQRGFAHRALGDALTALKYLPDDTPPTFSKNPDDYYQSAYKAFGEIKAEAEQARTVYAQAESLLRRGKRAAATRKFRHALLTFTQLGMADDAAKAGEAQMRAMLKSTTSD
jgi:tetratricopeptide (TPR) repeat protein